MKAILCWTKKKGVAEDEETQDEGGKVKMFKKAC